MNNSESSSDDKRVSPDVRDLFLPVAFVVTLASLVILFLIFVGALSSGPRVSPLVTTLLLTMIAWGAILIIAGAKWSLDYVEEESNPNLVRMLPSLIMMVGGILLFIMSLYVVLPLPK
ncbi:MAG: hypothetical protein R3C11_14780 [Planctomycetaceae bacterium]